MKNHVIADRINFRSSLAKVREPAFLILSNLQNVDADLQIEALSLTFTLLAQGAGLDPHALVTRAKRQIADADRVDNPHLEAISDFAKGELA